MKFKVTSRHIELTSASGLITAGSAGLDTCEFEWSAEWSGFAKTVVFRSGNVTASKVLVADNEVVQIPSKCLTTPNIPLEIGIYGQLGEKKMPTIWCVAINRVAIGTAPSDTGPEPTPSAYEQWVAQVQAYRDTAMQSASAAANSAADAALDVGQVDAAALSAVNSINSAGVEKVNAVNAAGAAQLNAINSAGESACAAIQSAKTDALSAINTQKTNSVSAVMSEGDTQVARVQQAAGYAYSKSESNARFAGALVVKESGNPITIYPDATGAPLTAISQRGKTTQSGTGDPSPTNIRPIYGVGLFDIGGFATSSEISLVRETETQIHVLCYGLDALKNVANYNENIFVSCLKKGVNGCTHLSKYGTKILAYFEKSKFPTLEGLTAYLQSQKNVFIAAQSTSYATAEQVYCGLSITDANGYHGYAAGPMEPLYEGDKLTWSGGSTVEVARVNGRKRATDLTWAEVSLNRVYAHVEDAYLLPNDTSLSPIISNQYTPTSRDKNFENLKVSLSVTAGVIFVCDAVNAASLQTWNSYISANYVEFVYRLATPTTETVAISEPITYAPGPITIAAENTVDVTYNKSLAKAFEQITAAIASLGTV